MSGISMSKVIDPLGFFRKPANTQDPAPAATPAPAPGNQQTADEKKKKFAQAASYQPPGTFSAGSSIDKLGG